MSKSQKKNQKRSNKKHGPEGFVVEETIGAGASVTKKQDPIQELREQLAQAKADKNHDLANKLRQQLWIAQDLAAGYKPNISTEDADSQEALAKAVETFSSPSSTAAARLAAAGPAATVPSTSTLGADERKLKTMRKKLEQIQGLKKKLEQGEKLEANQLAKIKTEESVLEEIEHLQTLLSIPVKR
ncbi:uncharacterized protein LOC119723507 [Patiria miniata]|uniref:Partner of Y14 and mago n=1 Tax=Patiria miniata TaxID=46514 RepID=A0A913ZEB2_PATMI|nr:uncharacterized protein LOC119723507 [Patiria miniata]XP_038050127.1 uncharacterized protein LOC119723507 [Patiria miniata]